MTELPTGMSISKIPITSLVMIFFTYLIIHIIIGVMYKKKQEEFDNMTTDTPDYDDSYKRLKLLGLLYKWFPAIAIVLILIGFYL